MGVLEEASEKMTFVQRPKAMRKLNILATGSVGGGLSGLCPWGRDSGDGVGLAARGWPDG